MGMTCSICNHPKRLDIDRQLVEGKSYAGIAREYGVNDDAARSHAREHLSRQLVQSFQQRQAAENSNLMGQIDQILARAEMIFKRNYRAKHDITALKALEQRNTIELLARIAAYLHQAKVDELDNNREAWEKEQRQAIAEGVKYLTTAELTMFRKLQDKILARDPSTIIIPDERESRYDVAPIPQMHRTKFGKRKDTAPPTSKRETKPMPAPTSSPTELRPLQSVQIPDGSDLPADQRNPFGDEARDVIIHRVQGT